MTNTIVFMAELGNYLERFQVDSRLHRVMTERATVELS